MGRNTIKIAYCGWHRTEDHTWFPFLNRYWTVDLYTKEDNLYKLSDVPKCLGEYDIIWVYHMGNIPPFINYIKEMRKQYLNTPIILTFDWEYNKDINDELFDNVDLVVHLSDIDQIGWDKKYSSKFLLSPIPLEFTSRHSNLDVDKKWVAVMQHSVSQVVLPNIEDVNIKVFGSLSENFMEKERWYPYLSWELYMHQLSKCYIGYDGSEYTGFSRFVIECSMFKIPVVSNTKVMANLIANPELCLDDYKKQERVIQMLLDNKGGRDWYGENAYVTLRNRLSYKYNEEIFRKTFRRLINAKNSTS